MNKLITTVLFLSILTSCKKPIADFSTDKNEYSAGDLVYINNESEHDHSYSWTFSQNSYNPYPTGKTSTEKNPVDTIDMMCDDGIHTIKLTAYSKNKKKTSIITKTFLIKTLRGTLRIFGPSYYNNVIVTADNQRIGIMNGGLLTVDLPVGARFISVYGPNGKKTQTTNIAYRSYTDWAIQ